LSSLWAHAFSLLPAKAKREALEGLDDPVGVVEETLPDGESVNGEGADEEFYVGDAEALIGEAFYGKQEKEKNDKTKEKNGKTNEPGQAVLVSGYDYLLGMPLWSLTLEKVEELRQQARSKTEELEKLKLVPHREMWIQDLDNFLKAFDKHEKAIEDESKTVVAAVRFFFIRYLFDISASACFLQRRRKRLSAKNPKKKMKANKDPLNPRKVASSQRIRI
jgi:hypothetical protein